MPNLLGMGQAERISVFGIARIKMEAGYIQIDLHLLRSRAMRANRYEKTIDG